MPEPVRKTETMAKKAQKDAKAAQQVQGLPPSYFG